MELIDKRLPANKADTEFQIVDLLSKRYSPRAFSERPVEDLVLNRLFEALRWASSSMNEQPWRVIYARRGEKAFDKIAGTLNPGNKHWAEKAPVLMLTLIKSTFDSGALNTSAHHDLGLAIGNFTVQATHEGIGVHQMGGFSADVAKEVFEIPEGYEPVTVVAFGYYGNPDDLPETLRQRELAKRTRKPISDFAFHEAFKI